MKVDYPTIWAIKGYEPPLGLKPKYIHDKTRIREILDAMERYSEQRFPIPIEWIEELRELID